MKIMAEVEEVELDGEYGSVDGLRVACSRCGESVDVYGRSSSSARRGAAELRDACTCRGSKFFVLDGYDD
ncbi:hypothetical protein QEZ47_17605 [Aminobacter anthyllidis]|uniref:hypothetical protein n=1 Tax=Aminobacter anthyllidis TaxID=1035067 RepID=UPI002458BCA0|nr:hypothetical protein [Aminobacter anthyllidis]MDH4987300.1 hypothetical protein [Aminobacter anthyllidis]